MVPRKSRAIPILLHEFYDSVIGGHSGELKTYLRLATNWYWRGMRKGVSDCAQQCTICQQQKVSQ